jgi:hypothetical protein
MIAMVKEVCIMGKESYIPEKAHEVMKNFKPVPYNKVQHTLDKATRKTLDEAQKLKEQRLSRQVGEGK